MNDFDESNLVFSYSPQTDLDYDKEGMTFIGWGIDKENREVHVLLRKGRKLEK